MDTDRGQNSWEQVTLSTDVDMPNDVGGVREMT